MFGRICDLYGRKKPFLFGSLWMAVFTLAVTFATSKLRTPRAFYLIDQYAT